MTTAHTLYGPGTDITAHATADVTGARFVKISGARNSGNIAVTHATAGARVLGVTGHDAKSGELVHILRGSRIIAVASTGTITAGADIAAAADGKATTADEGDVIVGQAIDAAANGIVYVALA